MNKHEPTKFQTRASWSVDWDPETPRSDQASTVSSPCQRRRERNQAWGWGWGRWAEIPPLCPPPRCGSSQPSFRTRPLCWAEPRPSPSPGACGGWQRAGTRPWAPCGPASSLLLRHTAHRTAARSLGVPGAQHADRQAHRAGSSHTYVDLLQVASLLAVFSAGHPAPP